MTQGSHGRGHGRRRHGDPVSEQNKLRALGGPCWERERGCSEDTVFKRHSPEGWMVPLPGLLGCPSPLLGAVPRTGSKEGLQGEPLPPEGHQPPWYTG